MGMKVDLRGLTCPEPVLRMKRLLDQNSGQDVAALVDDDVCVQNLTRLARSLKLPATVEELPGCFQVTIGSAGSASPAAGQAAAGASAQASGTIILFASDKFGDGDEDLSRTLVNLFLQTALDSGHLPRAILMANSGVKLLSPGSQVAPVLAAFRERGVEVLACGLCLEFYGLKESVDKAQITNMFAICEYIFAADKVLSP